MSVETVKQPEVVKPSRVVEKPEKPEKAGQEQAEAPKQAEAKAAPKRPPASRRLSGPRKAVLAEIARSGPRGITERELLDKTRARGGAHGSIVALRHAQLIETNSDDAWVLSARGKGLVKSLKDQQAQRKRRQR